MLTFDPGPHEYRWNGMLVPNVTRVLAPLYDWSKIDPDMLETARLKGVAVHKMVELDASFDLDEDGLPEWMRPVLAFWRQFVDESGLSIERSEQRLYHNGLGYAGTMDLLATMRGKQGLGVIDIKRSLISDRAVRLQTAAYAEAYNDGNRKSEKVKWRGALVLREDRPYRFESFSESGDFSVFCAALTHYRSGLILEKWRNS